MTFKGKSTLLYVSMSTSEVVSSTTVMVFIIFVNLQSYFNKMNDYRGEKFVVVVRGLPQSTTEECVAEFFSGKSCKIF